MNYAQKYDLFFPFFIKVVINKSKAYSFLIIGMMHLQKILLSVIMLRFNFSIAKQGTWVHKYGRGPYCTFFVSGTEFRMIRLLDAPGAGGIKMWIEGYATYRWNANIYVPLFCNSQNDQDFSGTCLSLYRSCSVHLISNDYLKSNIRLIVI